MRADPFPPGPRRPGRPPSRSWTPADIRGIPRRPAGRQPAASQQPGNRPSVPPPAGDRPRSRGTPHRRQLPVERPRSRPRPLRPAL